MTKICIVGMGAVGSHLAVHLANVPGITLTAVARGKRLAQLRSTAMRLETPTRSLSAHIDATDAPESLGRQDYVFLTMKAHQLPNALPSVRPLLDGGTAVIPPSAGIPYWYFYGERGPYADLPIDEIDAGGVLYSTLPPEQVIGCALWVGAELESDDLVRQHGSVAAYPLGEPGREVTERLGRLSSLLKAAGLAAPIRSDIRAEIWMKVINSLCWNSVALLTKSDINGIGTVPGIVDLVRRMMAEAEAVAATFGVAVPVPIEKRLQTALAAGSHRMSMLQDLEAARPLELNAVADSFHAMKRRSNVATPTIDDILNLAKLRAASQFLEARP